jgi:general L-amino acid transport system substrate-binding protein
MIKRAFMVMSFLYLSLISGWAMANKNGSTLAAIKDKGVLSCGVHTGLPGFSSMNSKGQWIGIDAEFCRAVASAVLGDPTKVRYVPLSVTQRFTALQTGEVDLLARNTTWTMQRDTQLGVAFTVVNFYDGQGFLVKEKANIKSVRDLNGARICFLNGTQTAIMLGDYFRKNNLTYRPVFMDDLKSIILAYTEGRCDSYSTDASQLSSIRINDMKNPDEHIVLPIRITKGPLGPVVRQGDDQWRNLVSWVHYAMIIAEELGVTSQNVDSSEFDSDGEAQRLLGRNKHNLGTGIGLDQQWAYRVIKYVGNYGEVFDRTVGKDSFLKLDRGQNALWSNGGLQYAPPF